MSEIDFNECHEAWQKRIAKELKEAEQRRCQALEAAKRAATYLRTQHQAQKVFLYGSLAWSKHFNIHSDIDLLVDGCVTDNYWRMVSEIEEITAPFQPSIIFSEDAAESLLKKIYREGLEINE
jgi:uncharacterized protein